MKPRSIITGQKNIKKVTLVVYFHLKQQHVNNMLCMFNKNTYTEFRTDYKHVLIPGYVI